jgi:hypothetical protein
MDAVRSALPAELRANAILSQTPWEDRQTVPQAELKRADTWPSRFADKLKKHRLEPKTLAKKIRRGTFPRRSL